MLKEKIKAYLDQMFGWYKEMHNELPRVPYNEDEPSALYVGEPNEEEWIQWQYVSVKKNVDFSKLEQKYSIHIHDQIKEYYNAYCFLELCGFYRGEAISIEGINELTDAAVIMENLLESNEEYLLIGYNTSCGLPLYVNIFNGQVVIWDWEIEKGYLFASSLAEILSNLYFQKKQKEEEKCLKEKIKACLDQWFHVWKEDQGTLPKVSYEEEADSNLYVGKPDKEGWIEWQYAPVKEMVDFSGLEQKYEVFIPDAVKEYYNAYCFLELAGFYKNACIYFNRVEDPADAAAVIEELLEKEGNYLFIGNYYKYDLPLCVKINGGQVVIWDQEKGREYFLAESLAELFASLRPRCMQGEETYDLPYEGINENELGYLRDPQYYFNALLNARPNYFSSNNEYRIKVLNIAPVNDRQFRKFFPEYDVQGLRGDVLVHYHVGGGQQAVAIPAGLLMADEGIMEKEKELGI